MNNRKMRKIFGGTQRRMRDSLIKQRRGYIGPIEHDNKLVVGSVQSMIFKPNDEGAFWLTPDQREAKREIRTV